MEKGKVIFEKSLTVGEKESTRENIRNWQNEGVEWMDGEIEKTDEEVKFIEKINEYLKSEYEELGIFPDQQQFIDPRRVHILSASVFRGRKAGANERAIYVNVDEFYRDEFIDDFGEIRFYKNKFAGFHKIFHESTHFVSAIKYHATREEITRYRSGFQIYNPKKKHGHFRGLNEAITEKITAELIENNREDIKKEFGLLNASCEGMGYADYINLLDIIIGSISKKTGNSEGETWKKFKKAMFTGQALDILKEMQKTFGSGYELIIDKFAGARVDQEREHKKDSKIKKYLSAIDDSERDSIARELLSSEEQRLYFKKRQR